MSMLQNQEERELMHRTEREQLNKRIETLLDEMANLRQRHVHFEEEYDDDDEEHDVMYADSESGRIRKVRARRSVPEPPSDRDH